MKYAQAGPMPFKDRPEVLMLMRKHGNPVATGDF